MILRPTLGKTLNKTLIKSLMAGGNLGGLISAAKSIEGLLFISDFKNKPRTSWNTAGHQYNNAVDTLPPNRWYQALEFTDTNADHITIPALPAITSCLEIGFWIKYDGVGAGLVYALDARDATNDGFRIGRDGANYYWSWNAQGQTGSETLVAGNWYYYHLYIASDRSYNFTIYNQDGSVFETDTDSTSDTDLETTVTPTIGKHSFAASNYLDGMMKDFILFANCSSQTITGIPSNPISLVNADCHVCLPMADYDVADGVRTAGELVLDYSGNGNDGTIQGTSVTPVYTPSIGYEVVEGQFNEYVNFNGISGEEITLAPDLSVGGDTGYIELVMQLSTPVASIQRIIGVGLNDYIGFSNSAGGRVLYWTNTGGDVSYANVGVDGYFDDKIHTLRFELNNGSISSFTIDGVAQVPSSTPTDMYVIDVDYISFNGQSEMPVFKLDYNGTVIYPNKNVDNGTIGGTPEYIKVFNVGNKTDRFGDTIPDYVGATSPDAKAFTGGAIDTIPANLDRVTFNNITLDDSFTFMFWVRLDGTFVNTTIFNILGNSANTSGLRLVYDEPIGFFSSEIIVNGVGVNQPFAAIAENTWAHFAIIYDDEVDELTVIINGLQFDNLYASTPGSLIINTVGLMNTSYSDNGFAIKDLAIFGDVISNLRVAEYYNNPNKFVEYVRSDNALLAYDFNNGTYSAGSPVIDVSGNDNHGTVQGASAEMALNNVEVGSQTVTHGWSLYGYVTGTGTISTTGTALTGVGTSFTTELAVGDLIWASGEIVKIASITDNTNAVLESAPNVDFSGDSFAILDQDDNTTNLLISAISDIGTTDIFGNTVQRPWKAGILNPSPFNHDALLLGATGDFDYSQYTIVSLLLLKNLSTADTTILSTRTAGDGVTYSILSTELANLENEEDSTAANDSADTTLTVGDYVLAVEIESNGLTEHFKGTDSVAMASDSAATQLRASVGQSSTALRIGALGDGSDEIDNPISPILYSKKLTLAELEKLRKELIKLIP